VPGGEVVAAVDHYVGARDERLERAQIHALRHRRHADLRVDGGDALAGGLDLGASDRGGVEQHLPLQVREIDVVGVDQGQVSDAGGGEELRDRIAQPADAHHERVRRAEALLGVHAELLEEDVAAVAQELTVVHGGHRRQKRPVEPGVLRCLERCRVVMASPVPRAPCSSPGPAGP
jgi:hypothetical protein